MNTMKKWSLLLVVVGMAMAAPLSLAAETISIGSKNFTENVILGEILAQFIEAQTDLKVERRFNLGGTFIAFGALKRGDVDLYPEYTGTALMTILKLPKVKGPQAQEKSYDIVKRHFKERFHIHWFSPFGFNNTYIMAVRDKDPRFKKVSKISQLRPLISRLKIGIDHEMKHRPDGLSNLQRHYRLPITPSNVLEFDPGLMYVAIENKQLDVIVAYSTDGRLESLGLRTLEDDGQFFPPYHAASLIRMSTLKRHPQLEGLLERLGGKISDEIMRGLNYRVDELNIPAEQVAATFLLQEGLAASFSEGESLGPDSSFFSYVWHNKKRLISLLREHLFLTFAALGMAIALGLPLGIAATRMKWLEGPIFTVVNFFQTIPSLALLGLFIPLLGIGSRPAIVALFLYALLPIVRNTFTGISQLDRDLIESAKALGISEAQIMLRVKIPLAFPIIMASIRVCAVIMIGTATLAALVGGGGLGTPIFRGISTLNVNEILFGAVPAAVLAITMDKTLHYLEGKLTSPGLR